MREQERHVLFRNLSISEDVGFLKEETQRADRVDGRRTPAEQSGGKEPAIKDKKRISAKASTDIGLFSSQQEAERY